MYLIQYGVYIFWEVKWHLAHGEIFPIISDLKWKAELKQRQVEDKRLCFVVKRKSKEEQVRKRGIKNESEGFFLGGGSEVATADFTWVLYIPRGEVGLSAPPSDKGTEGREGGGVRGEESCPTAAFINMRTCSLWRYSETNRCCPFHINTRTHTGTTHSHTSPNSNTNTLLPTFKWAWMCQIGPHLKLWKVWNISTCDFLVMRFFGGGENLPTYCPGILCLHSS